jgi:outer membrane protein OmpA-like peptidoglycan-associated protein
LVDAEDGFPDQGRIAETETTMRRLVLAALPLLALAACTNATPRETVRAVVFFNEDSAALDENAQELLTQVAEQAVERPTAVVRVRGFAGPDSGTARYNRTLSELRARHVTEHLVSAGVDRLRIRLEPRGAVPYEMYPTESRRVEVILGR